LSVTQDPQQSVPCTGIQSSMSRHPGLFTQKADPDLFPSAMRTRLDVSTPSSGCVR
jgi:hypothetical protein